MLRKKLFLIPLVMSGEAVYAISPDAVKTALSNYCVPYSDIYEEGRVFNTPVCASVFEGKYNPSKSGVKCDCYEGSAATAKFLKYDSDTDQRKCRPQCDSGYGAKKVSACPDGYFKSGIQKTSNGSYMIFDCEICKEGNYSNNGFECLQCDAGTHNDKQGKSACEICPAGTYSGTGAIDCTPCPEGTHCPAGSKAPINCPAGQYAPINSTKCKPCEKGFKCSGNGFPQVCPDGQYQDEQGQATCKSCSAGYFCTKVKDSSGKVISGAIGQTECGKGKYSTGGTGSCSSCTSDTELGRIGGTCGNRVGKKYRSYCTQEVNTSNTANSQDYDDVKPVDCCWGQFEQYDMVEANNSGTLPFGTYYFEMNGGHGGKSGKSGYLGKWCDPRSGGSGQYLNGYFDVSLSGTSYSKTIGGNGGNGSDGHACIISNKSKTGGSGGNGGNSSLYVAGVNTWTALGGGGGMAYSGDCKTNKCHGGSTGTDYGGYWWGGFVYIYKHNPSKSCSDSGPGYPYSGYLK